jgi:Ca2+-binding RTX toxin-like protein
MSFARGSCCLAAGAVTALCGLADVRAQTAATCTFDEASATVRVSVDGEPATLSRVGTGAIRLNGVDCGGATATNTDTVVIRGGPLADNVTLSGDFAPGLTHEPGISEIEIQLVSIQNFTWALGNDENTMVGSPGGFDFGGDGDIDVTGLGINALRRILGGNGDDVLDFSDRGGNFALDGESGDDDLTGGSGNNGISGGPGDDTLRGGPGNDRIDGEVGNDTEIGGSGNDTFAQGAAANGSDSITGGAGRDTADYGRRGVSVNVTLGSGDADDGEATEGDDVAGDVENATGGSGDDTLVGTSGRNTLRGEDGNDELLGGANRDLLLGGAGDDFVQGDAGSDNMHGDEGNDVLVGDAAALDRFFAGDGDDEIVGNTDGRAEPVNCGAGTDVVEANDEDNFVDCEL